MGSKPSGSSSHRSPALPSKLVGGWEAVDLPGDETLELTNQYEPKARLTGVAVYARESNDLVFLTVMVSEKPRAVKPLELLGAMGGTGQATAHGELTWCIRTYTGEHNVACTTKRGPVVAVLLLGRKGEKVSNSDLARAVEQVAAELR